MCVYLDSFLCVLLGFNILSVTDLREDRGYLVDHMNSNVITSAQVCIC